MGSPQPGRLLVFTGHRVGLYQVERPDADHRGVAGLSTGALTEHYRSRIRFRLSSSHGYTQRICN